MKPTHLELSNLMSTETYGMETELQRLSSEAPIWKARLGPQHHYSFTHLFPSK